MSARARVLTAIAGADGDREIVVTFGPQTVRVPRVRIEASNGQPLDEIAVDRELQDKIRALLESERFGQLISSCSIEGARAEENAHRATERRRASVTAIGGFHAGQCIHEHGRSATLSVALRATPWV